MQTSRCIAFLMVGLACCSCLVSRSEEHLIPDGFVGRVLILYDDPQGVPMRVKDGAISYAIPPNGILRINGHKDSGWRRIRYFYVGRDGQRKQLQATGADSDFGIFNDVSGTDFHNNVAIRYRTYLVGSPDMKQKSETIEGAIKRALSGASQESH